MSRNGEIGMASPKEYGWQDYQCPDCHVLDEAYFEKHGDLLFTILRCCKCVVVDPEEQEVIA